MYSLDKNLSFKNRSNQPGGNTIYLCDYANVASVIYDSEMTYISGITMVGNNKFYRYDLPKGNINFSNNVQISVPNACYIFNPLLNFNAPGLQKSKLKLYDFLARKSVIAIVRTNMNQYFVLGAGHGIDMESGSNFMSGKAGVELIGASYSLRGAERIRITQIDPSVVDSIMNSIVYVNVPPTLSGTSSGTSITLTWNFGDMDEAIIHIEKSLYSMSGFTEIYKSTLSEKSYVDTDIDEETEYFYRYWFDNGTDIIYSNTFDVWSTYCNFILSITNTTDNEIDLTWDYGCYTKRNPIEIEQSFDGTGYTLIYTTLPFENIFNNTGLTFNTNYYYRIRMWLTTKYSRYSNIVNTKTLYYPMELALLTKTDTGATFSVNAGSLNNFSMKLFKNTIYSRTLPSGTTSIIESGLTFDTEYTYYLSSTYDNLDTYHSDLVSFTTDRYPMVLNGNAIDEYNVSLNWSFGSYTQYTITEIERSLQKTTGFTLIASLTGSTSSFTNSGLTGSTDYYYRVRSKSGSTYSLYSNILFTTTRQLPPVLSGTTISNTKIKLDWSYGGSIAGIVEVSRSSLSGSGYSIIYTTPTTGLTYTNTGLTSGTTYYYKVRSFANGYWTNYSNIINMTTNALLPNITNISHGDFRRNVNNFFNVTVTNPTDSDGFYVKLYSADAPGWNLTSAINIINQDDGYTFEFSSGFTSTGTKNVRVRLYNDANVLLEEQNHSITVSVNPPTLTLVKWGFSTTDSIYTKIANNTLLGSGPYRLWFYYQHNDPDNVLMSGSVQPGWIGKSLTGNTSVYINQQGSQYPSYHMTWDPYPTNQVGVWGYPNCTLNAPIPSGQSSTITFNIYTNVRFNYGNVETGEVYGTVVTDYVYNSVAYYRINTHTGPPYN